MRLPVPVKVGLFAGAGGLMRLPGRVGHGKAMEMALTGDPITAREALACGLVSQVVAADALLPAARALAARIVRNPGNVLRMTKRLMHEGQSMSLDSVLQMSAGLQVIAHKSPQHLEAIDAFIEKRSPVFSDN